MSLEHVPEIEVAYSAGLFDGEGSIHISQDPAHHKLQIQMGNSYRPVLDWFSARWGGTIYELGPDPRQPNARQFWNLHWQGREERERLLRAFLPYLIVKREAAEIALRWLETIIDRRTPRAHRHYSKVLAIRGRLAEDLRSLTEFRPRRERGGRST